MSVIAALGRVISSYKVVVLEMLSISRPKKKKTPGDCYDTSVEYDCL